MSQQSSNPNLYQNWKKRTLISGALIGTAVGLSTAYLYTRTAEEAGYQEPPQIKTGDVIRVALGVIGTIRGIASLGE